MDMTQGKHTPGCLKVSKVEPHNILSTHPDSVGLSIAMATRFVPLHRDKSIANAARLAACWNACEGITDPSAIKDVVEALRTASGRLRWASVANPGVSDPAGKDLVSEWADEANAILAKLNGGAS